MGTTADKLNKLIETKSAIRQAIIDKGGEVSEDTVFADYPARIKAIEHDFFYNAVTKNGTDYSHLCEEFRQDQICDFSKYDTSQVRTMYSMFYDCRTVTSLNVSNWNTSSVENMGYMFYGCKSLTSLDLSNWDLGNVKNMHSMFNSCESLTSLNTLNWDTGNVTDMGYMFYGCSSLTSIDVSDWDMSNATDISCMFYDCNSLTSLDVSSWNTGNVVSMYNIFHNCSSLTSLDVSNWDTGGVENMYCMFIDCTSLTSLDISGWDTSNVTRIDGIFHNCNNLTTVTGEFDLSNLSYGCYQSGSYYPFYNCSKLETLYLKNIYKNCTMTNHEKWSIILSPTAIKDECLIYIINELPDLINDKGLTDTSNIEFVLPPNNTLTSSQVRPAINKGWQVYNTNY